MTGIADAFESPLDRGYAMVGRFLQEWSFMEHELRNAIGKALGLTNIQSVWVCANISFRDKINILKTAVDVATIYPTTDKDALRKELDTISGHAPTRNMIAHDAFTVSDDGAEVSFFVVKAKGKFDLPETVWDAKRFDEEYKQLRKWAASIKEMTARLQTANLAKALMERVATPGATTTGLFGLGLLNSQTLPPEGNPHSNPVPSTEGTETQTPENLQD